MTRRGGKRMKKNRLKLIVTEETDTEEIISYEDRGEEDKETETETSLFLKEYMQRRFIKSIMVTYGLLV